MSAQVQSGTRRRASTRRRLEWRAGSRRRPKPYRRATPATVVAAVVTTVYCLAREFARRSVVSLAGRQPATA